MWWGANKSVWRVGDHAGLRHSGSGFICYRHEKEVNQMSFRIDTEFSPSPIGRFQPRGVELAPANVFGPETFRLGPSSPVTPSPYAGHIAPSRAANRIPFHPAPGFGDLVEGFLVVPQNPLRMAQDGISRVRTLGEFLAGSFPVPQNPVRDYSTGMTHPLGQGLSGCGCGGGCGCGSGGGGMGALDLSSLTTFIQEDSLGMGLPNWGYAAVGVIAYMFLFGTAGGTGRSRVSRARKAYTAYSA
jgi:hypothetical protein